MKSFKKDLPCPVPLKPTIIMPAFTLSFVHKEQKRDHHFTLTHCFITILMEGRQTQVAWNPNGEKSLSPKLPEMTTVHTVHRIHSRLTDLHISTIASWTLYRLKRLYILCYELDERHKFRTVLLFSPLSSLFDTHLKYTFLKETKKPNKLYYEFKMSFHKIFEVGELK